VKYHGLLLLYSVSEESKDRTAPSIIELYSSSPEVGTMSPFGDMYSSSPVTMKKISAFTGFKFIFVRLSY